MIESQIFGMLDEQYLGLFMGVKGGNKDDCIDFGTYNSVYGYFDGQECKEKTYQNFEDSNFQTKGELSS